MTVSGKCQVGGYEHEEISRRYINTPTYKPTRHIAHAYIGDTDDEKYDFNPLALTNAEDVRNKCCKPNCFSTMKKRKLTCTTGVARSKWDGHQPFSNGFAKQSDKRILQECCSENCYSYFTANKLTCDTGVVRGMCVHGRAAHTNTSFRVCAKVER